ncbi:hypothetical protein DPEC_G00358750 [Dallia pectoralis]|uniref:Uncharacterized protein n=1 Tax=Dallia pectoralis TaxID=75939 RepID=A0ACC2F0C3_DALPE|nr:hypothetical protein DPEC_G00358750 [Dallia pectoralis]
MRAEEPGSRWERLWDCGKTWEEDGSLETGRWWEREEHRHLASCPATTQHARPTPPPPPPPPGHALWLCVSPARWSFSRHGGRPIKPNLQASLRASTASCRVFLPHQPPRSSLYSSFLI